MFRWLFGGKDENDYEISSNKRGIFDVEDEDTLDDYVRNLTEAENSRENN